MFSQVLDLFVLQLVLPLGVCKFSLIFLMLQVLEKTPQPNIQVSIPNLLFQVGPSGGKG